MNFRFSKCAIALTLALLTASHPKLVQAEEIASTNPAPSTEANQTVPVEANITEEVSNIETVAPTLNEVEDPITSATSSDSDSTSNTTEPTVLEARTVAECCNTR